MFSDGHIDSNRKTSGHEKPVHKVCLDGFWMGKFEVTNAQYRKYQPEHDSGTYRAYTLDNDHQPVVFISWESAEKFANWLTAQNTGKHLFRLPTEAEWEYACRAKTKTDRYWNKDSDTCSYANIGYMMEDDSPGNIHLCRDGYFQSSPVGRFESNPWGLYDMLGNVWEWCQDVYGKDAYKNHQKRNPQYKRMEIGIDLRVIRGGSWQSGPGSVRCAKRNYNPPANKFDVIGFRLVMEP